MDQPVLLSVQQQDRDIDLPLQGRVRASVGEQAAIRVSSVGETRDPANRMLQQRST